MFSTFREVTIPECNVIALLYTVPGWNLLVLLYTVPECSIIAQMYAVQKGGTVLERAMLGTNHRRELTLPVSLSP